MAAIDAMFPVVKLAGKVKKAGEKFLSDANSITGWKKSVEELKMIHSRTKKVVDDQIFYLMIINLELIRCSRLLMISREL